VRDPCPRTRLLGRSSPGVRLPFTVFPEVSARDLSIEGTSPGVCCPCSAYRSRESTSVRLSGSASSVVHRGFYRRFPCRRLRCRSRAFPAPQRPCSSPDRPAIFRRVTLVGSSPFRGLSLPRSPDRSSPPVCPLDVLPAGCATPVLGGGIRGRSSRCLGHHGAEPLIVFRAFVRKEIDPHHRDRLRSR
jgi:hypothetical protein